MRRHIAAALGAGLILSGCATSDDSTAELTLGLTYIPDVQFAPVYIAEELGYFDDEGVDVTIRHHGAQESLFGALESGEEDIVFAGGAEMAQAQSTGIDVVNWATLYQQYPVTLIADAASGITSPADLSNRTVGLPGPYGENYFALLAMIDAHDLENMEISYIGYTQSAALLSGEVDAIVGYSNNDAVALERAGIDVTEIEMVDGGLPLVGVGLGSLRSDIDEENYGRILSALERAVDYALADPEAAMDIVTEYVPSLTAGEQREAATVVLERTLALYKGDAVFGSQNAQVWEEMAAFLLEAGIVETALDPARLYIDLVSEPA